MVVPADNQELSRLNCINHLLSMIPYEHIPSGPIVLPPRRENPAYVRPPISEQTFVPDRYSQKKDTFETI
jgi:polyphosphate kinase